MRWIGGVVGFVAGAALYVTLLGLWMMATVMITAGLERAWCLVTSFDTDCRWHSDRLVFVGTIIAVCLVVGGSTLMTRR